MVQLFDLKWINSLSPSIFDDAQDKIDKLSILDGKIMLQDIQQIIECLDLTSLNDCDTEETIEQLVLKGTLLIKSYSVQVASICVYPLYISTCINSLLKAGTKLSVTSVETSFPHGKLPLDTSLYGIKGIILDGANEVDIVVNRGNIISLNWQSLYDEVLAKRQCISHQSNVVGRGVIMKTILSVGDIDDTMLVYKASLIAMMAGSDFIKTSTGKEPKSTTPLMAYAMLMAIRHFYDKYAIKVGFKVAGGVRKCRDALLYRKMVLNILGSEWLDPSLFRIGASSLLDDILSVWEDKLAET